ncbi:MAG TPA: hypothetical protein VNK95_14445 [Caldilineaceae bacterium]|nr:hypothetical protein [Caldilineaceae bacterium]
MHSSSFRMVSVAVSSLLLAALVAVIVLAIRDNPTSALPRLLTPTPPAESAAAPTDAGATGANQPVAEQAASGPSVPTRVADGGFSLHVPPGYRLVVEGGSAQLSAGEESPAAGAQIVITGGPRKRFAAGAGESAEALLSRLAADFAAPSALAVGSAGAIRAGGVEGLAAALVSETISGQFVLVQPAPDHIVTLSAVAPVAVWEGQAAADFSAVLNTLAFFPPGEEESRTAAAATAEAVPTAETTAPGEAAILPSPTPAAGTLPATPAPGGAAAPEESTVQVPEGVVPTPGATAVVTAGGSAGPVAGAVVALLQAGQAPTVRVYSNSNFVNRVAVMRSTIWAATGGGVVAWNKSSGGYVKFTTADGLLINHTLDTAVCPLPGLGVLFASDLGIQVFDTTNGRWKTMDPTNSGMSHSDVAALWCDPEDGFLVVGYGRHGLDLYDANADEWTYLDEDDGLAAMGIRAIAVDRDRSPIWLATDSGLAAYEDGQITLYTTQNSPLVENRIEALAVDGSGAVWLATGDTLYRTNGETWDAFSAASAGQASFPNGRITGLDVGDDGAIWIGSDQAQLCRFDPAIEGCIAFYSGEEGMATAPLTSLTIGPDGHVYYTTAGGGISVFDGEGWRSLVIANEMAPGNAVHDLALDEEGALWVAATGGAARLSPDNDTRGQLYTPANSPLPSVDLRVVEPGGGGVWLGGAGLSFFDGADWRSYTTEDGLAGASVQAITPDNQSRTWIGTPTGLSIWTGNAFFNLTSANGLPSDDISALQADGDVIWIGTRGGGLLRFQDNQLQVFNRDNIGLPGDVITALAVGADGALYVGTERGLARFAGNTVTPIPALGDQAIVALAAGRPEVNAGIVWAATAGNEVYVYDGQSWAPFTPAHLPGPQITALLLDTAGDLWVGCGQGGLARYTPS